MGVRSGSAEDRAQIVVEDNLSANGSTNQVELFGVCNIAAKGNFGGGTLALEKSFDGGTVWFVESISPDGTPSGWVADFSLRVEETERGVYYRFTLSGATSPDIDTHMSGQSRVL